MRMPFEDRTARRHGAAEQIIRTLESEFDVNGLLFRGMRVWPWVRNRLLAQYAEYDVSNLISRGPRIWPRIKRKLPHWNLVERNQFSEPPRVDPGTGEAPSDLLDRRLSQLIALNRKSGPPTSVISGLDQIGRADILFFSRPYDQTRSYLVEGSRFDTITDPIVRVARLDFSWVKISFFGPGATPEAKAYYRDISLVPKTDIAFIGMMDDLQRFLFAQSGEKVEGWHDLARTISKIIRIKTPLLSPKFAAKHLMTIDYYSALFRLILAKINPRAVFFVGQNSQTFALAKACHKVRIPCVDLQHGAGAIISSNIKWFGWKQVPPGGYEFLPDYFWVWSDAAAERIRRSMGGEGHHHVPVVGGYPWLHTCTELMKVERACPSVEFKILVTLPNMSSDSIPDHLFEAMQRGPSNWHWSIRLHPADAKNEGLVSEIVKQLESLNIERFDVRSASMTPLPALLATIHRHVSLYSSCCVDASTFGHGTIFIHPKAKALFADLLRKPGFQVALNADDLLKALTMPQQSPAPLATSGADAARSTLRAIVSQPARRYPQSR